MVYRKRRSLPSFSPVTLSSRLLFLLLLLLLLCCSLPTVTSSEWKFDANVYNQETINGVWDFMDEDENERSRHAIIGDVYIRKHAPKNGSVLDIGCATGTLSDYIIPTQSYEGHDLGCEAIKKGKKKRPTVNLNCGDAQTLVPQKQYYDVIVFNEMLYFVDVKAVIEKYKTYLRPQTGFIMISLFKFLSLKNGKTEHLEKDKARENILGVVHSLLNTVNQIEVVGNTFDGKASWLIKMVK
jgi:2-polyprenyl-3-methyl-5-hydroxy-6-metoxy-1,4-benzoquinol methylase